MTRKQWNEFLDKYFKSDEAKKISDDLEKDFDDEKDK